MKSVRIYEKIFARREERPERNNQTKGDEMIRERWNASCRRVNEEREEERGRDSVVGWRSYELRRKWRDQQKRSEKEKNKKKKASEKRERQSKRGCR